MTDDELAMAYADGELDAVSARRFEKRMAEAPELAEAVRAHRALRETLAQAFAPVAEAPLPDRFTALLSSNVIELRPRRRFALPWRVAASMAACLVAGVAIGQFWHTPSSGVSGERLMASAPLAHALDRQLAGDPGAVQVLVSYRDRDGKYCRIFTVSQIDGIACREDRGWALRRTQAHSAGVPGEYRQAGSNASDLMAAAQETMRGDPLDPAAERAARDSAWR